MKKSLYFLCLLSVSLSAGCMNWGDKKDACTMKKGSPAMQCPCTKGGKTCGCPKNKDGSCPCTMKGKKNMKHMKGESMTNLTAEQLKERMAKEKDLLVINVLSDKIYQDCRIKGSINIPGSEIAEQAKAEGWPKDKKMVLYCANYACMASRMAHKTLTDLGFTNVKTYEGGTKEWREKEYGTEGPCTAIYLK